MVEQLVLMPHVVLLHHLDAHALLMIQGLLLGLTLLDGGHCLEPRIDHRRVVAHGVHLDFPEDLLDLFGLCLPDTVSMKQLFLDVEFILVLASLVLRHCHVLVTLRSVHFYRMTLLNGR